MRFLCPQATKIQLIMGEVCFWIREGEIIINKKIHILYSERGSQRYLKKKSENEMGIEWYMQIKVKNIYIIALFDAWKKYTSMQTFFGYK